MTETKDAPGNWRSHSSAVFTEVEFPPATPVKSRINPGVALKIIGLYGDDVLTKLERKDPWRIGPHLGVYVGDRLIARWRPDSNANSWMIQESPEAAERFKAHTPHP
ncbi:MAG: hypothetical protein AAB887_01300 [Patescibacteria group bacterium]